MSFGRHSSVSSTASLGLRPSRAPQKISDMTNSQQRDLIKQIIQTSKGQSSNGEDAKMTNQASFGDAAMSRLDSMMSMESSSVTGLSSWSRASSIAREATPPTSVAQTQGQSPKLLAKRSSNHKLERMQNVSSMDLNPFDSPPPPVHYPVQRQDTDVSRKIVQAPPSPSPPSHTGLTRKMQLLMTLLTLRWDIHYRGRPVYRVLPVRSCFWYRA